MSERDTTMTSESSQQRSMICIADLPTGALAQVSSFLPSLSRAILAVSLNYLDVDSSSAIVGGQWDALDFGHIEKELASKISDHDIRGVLLCIDAVNTVKKLRLTNCINITGVGLEPLRGSAIIEQIDLSLVGDHESSDLNPEPPILCNEVLPILDSIIERGECDLKHLQFPKVWRKERNTESEFHAFLTRYNRYLVNRDVSCLKCNNYLAGGVNQMSQIGRDEYEYGSQTYTCYDCIAHYCHNCEDDGVYYISSVCKKCERCYCSNCSREGSCTSCDIWWCMACSDFKRCYRCQTNNCPACVSETECHSCGSDNIWCTSCVVIDDVFRSCDGCSVSNCEECCTSNIHAVKFCFDCEESLCGQCRVNKCKEGRNCTRCCQFALPVQLLEDRERLRQEHQEMQNEINELRKENNELKRKIEDLTG